MHDGKATIGQCIYGGGRRMGGVPSSFALIGNAPGCSCCGRTSEVTDSCRLGIVASRQKQSVAARFVAVVVGVDIVILIFAT